MLHHPAYRGHFAANLQREIPRVPMAADLWRYAEVGGKLIDLHLGYEEAPLYELEWTENPELPLSYRVTDRMRLDRKAGTIQVNESLTLGGVPNQAFEYMLGTRCALEWVVDQCRCEKDDDGEITSDPNDPDNERYLIELIERVTTVSLDTLALIRSLPPEIRP